MSTENEWMMEAQGAEGSGVTCDWVKAKELYPLLLIMRPHKLWAFRE